MAKKPKTLVEKAIEGVDKILHPESHEQGPQDQAQEIEKGQPETQPEAVESVTETYEDSLQMGDHKKFDKFKNQGEHLDDK